MSWINLTARTLEIHLDTLVLREALELAMEAFSIFKSPPGHQWFCNCHDDELSEDGRSVRSLTFRFRLVDAIQVALHACMCLVCHVVCVTYNVHRYAQGVETILVCYLQYLWYINALAPVFVWVRSWWALIPASCVVNSHQHLISTIKEFVGVFTLFTLFIAILVLYLPTGNNFLSLESSLTRIFDEYKQQKRWNWSSSHCGKWGNIFVVFSIYNSCEGCWIWWSHISLLSSLYLQAYPPLWLSPYQFTSYIFSRKSLKRLLRIAIDLITLLNNTV